MHRRLLRLRHDLRPLRLRHGRLLPSVPADTGRNHRCRTGAVFRRVHNGAQRAQAAWASRMTMSGAIGRRRAVNVIDLLLTDFMTPSCRCLRFIPASFQLITSDSSFIAIHSISRNVFELLISRYV